jgi:hypothetical protein
MLETVILTSLQILAIWVCFQEGMIFSFFRRALERTLASVLHKPFFECLTCMGGLWTFILWCIERPACGLLQLMLPVIGLNYLLAIWKDQFFLPHGKDHPGEL